MIKKEYLLDHAVKDVVGEIDRRVLECREVKKRTGLTTVPSYQTLLAERGIELHLRSLDARSFKAFSDRLDNDTSDALMAAIARD